VREATLETQPLLPLVSSHANPTTSIKFAQLLSNQACDSMERQFVGTRIEGLCTDI
jgi:hypothetical protein